MVRSASRLNGTPVVAAAVNKENVTARSDSAPGATTSINPSRTAKGFAVPGSILVARVTLKMRSFNDKAVAGVLCSRCRSSLQFRIRAWRKYIRIQLAASCPEAGSSASSAALSFVGPSEIPSDRAAAAACSS